MFPFLELPREIRDSIYELTLFRGDIDINDSQNSPLTWEDAVSNDAGRHVDLHLSTPNTQNNVVERPEYVLLAALSTPNTEDYAVERPEYVLLAANRQIRAEALSTFLSENTFRFKREYGWIDDAHQSNAPLACLAFLNHQRMNSVSAIRNIQLDIGTDRDACLFAGTSRKVWTDLCEELGRISTLKSLTLGIAGELHCEPQRSDSTCCEPGFQDGWREDLCKVSGLEDLEIVMENNDSIEQQLELVNVLRASMMKGGAPLTKFDVEVFWLISGSWTHTFR